MKKIILLFSILFSLVLNSQTSVYKPGWNLLGNSTSSNNFLGTTNNQSLIFKTNNIQRFTIDNIGGVYNTGASATKENIYYGVNCGTVTTNTGIESAVFGLNSFALNRSGNSNSVFGTYTARSFTNSGQNCILGSDAISNATVSSGNSVIGVQALQTYTGQGYNNVMGLQAMRSLTTGSFNIGIGYRAADGFTNGIGNIFLGNNMSVLTNGNNNVFIGGAIVSPSNTLSNNIIIADGQGNIRYRWNGTTNSFTNSVTTPTLSLGTATNLVGGNSGTVAVFSDILFTTTHFHSLVSSTVTSSTSFFDKSFGGLCSSSNNGCGITVIPYNATLIGYSLNNNVLGQFGSATNSTISVRVNNTTDILLTNVGRFTATTNTFTSNSLNTNINANDYIEIKEVISCTPTGVSNFSSQLTLYWRRR